MRRVQAGLLGGLEPGAQPFVLGGGQVLQRPAVDELVQTADVGAVEQGVEQRDADRAAALLGGRRHARGLALVAVRDGVQAHGVVHRQHESQPDAVEQQAGQERGVPVGVGDPRGQGEAGEREDGEAGDERRAAAGCGRTSVRPAARR